MQTIDKSAIDAVATLADRAKAAVSFTPLPDAALPANRLVIEPHVGIVTHAGKAEVFDLKPYVDAQRVKPVFRTGTAQAKTLDSFIELVNRHKSADTAIFVDADWRKPAFTAVVDYHQRAALMGVKEKNAGDTQPVLHPAAVGEDPLARNCKHRIGYAFPFSESWQAWVKMDGQPMEQGDFAAFLEDRIHETSSPMQAEEIEYEQKFRTKIATPSQLIDLARGLDIRVNARVKNRVNLQTGETQIVFETENRDAEGNDIIVPGLFMLAIPVFYRGETVRTPVRLRYRPKNGSLVWFYNIYRPDEIVDETVRNDVLTVADRTGLPVYDGAPEA